MYMKFRRALSGLLFGLGCAVVFIGVLAVILPNINNSQLKLVLASFEEPSRHAVVNAIHQFTLFAISHGWQVLAVGMISLILGIVLLLKFTEPAKPMEENIERFQRPVSEPVPAPVNEENPFAVAASPEPQEVGFLSYQRPLLEPNHIDENLPYLPPTFSGESVAILTERGEASPSGACTILRTPQTIVPQVEGPVKPELPPPKPVVSAEPVPAPAPKPAGNRIRSTMGQHKQW